MDIDFDALVYGFARGHALREANARALGEFEFFRRPTVVGCRRREGQAGLGVVWARTAATDAIGFQAARDFHAPFGFDGNGRIGGRFGASGYTCRNWLGSLVAGDDERGVTESAFFGGLEQKRAALRANLYHWSVLRCGSSSDGTRVW